jgi:murein DD-endopeptidase MepM/ murein hydrolase activator NlpD
MRCLRAALAAAGSALALAIAVVPAAFAVEVPVWTRAVPAGKAIVARNDYYAPLLVEVELTGLRDAVGTTASRIAVVVPPRREMLIATIPAAQPGVAPSFSYRTAYSLGDPQAEHDAAALYRLPFGDGLRFAVTQAPGGTVHTHDTPDTQYAIDFAMPAGTPIVAARGGRVMQTVQHHGEGRADPAFLHKTNLVRVVHDDGTWADYAHLQRASVRVRAGQRVETGDLLALSGNSGFTFGPHLHFAVKRNRGGEIVSVPVRFHSAVLGVFEPREGMSLAAIYGAQPRFAGLDAE